MYLCVCMCMYVYACIRYYANFAFALFQVHIQAISMLVCSAYRTILNVAKFGTKLKDVFCFLYFAVLVTNFRWHVAIGAFLVIIVLQTVNQFLPSSPARPPTIGVVLCGVVAVRDCCSCCSCCCCCWRDIFAAVADSCKGRSSLPATVPPLIIELISGLISNGSSGNFALRRHVGDSEHCGCVGAPVADEMAPRLLLLLTPFILAYGLVLFRWCC